MGKKNAQHQHIFENILQLIRMGVYKPGDRLPSEVQLSEEYGVSRMTARRAIKALENEGVLYSRQGVGTFVKHKPTERSLNELLGLSEEISRTGLDFSTQVIKLEKVKPPTDVRRKLNIDNDQEIFIFERVHLVGDNTIALIKSYVPYSICPQLPEIVELPNISFTTFIDKRNPISYANQTISMMLATPKLAKTLHVEVDTFVVFVERITYAEDGKIVEYAQVWSNPHFFSAKVTLKRQSLNKLY